MENSKLAHDSNKFAVVTGGLGYIGSRVVLLLASSQWEVICLVRPDANLKVFPNSLGIRFIHYDGTFKSLSKLKDLPPNRTVYIHLAASYAKTEEIENTNSLLESNIEYGLNLSKFMVKNEFTRLIHAESYWQFDEFGNMQGNSLYAATKSAFSLVLEYMSKHYLSCTALVLYDVYGPNDSRGKIINIILNQASMMPAISATEGKQIIDYVHVEDVARAFLAASELILINNSPIGFRRHTVRSMLPMSLRDYIELAANATNKSLNVNWGGTPYPVHQIFKPWLPEVLMQLPGWSPIVKFEDGVKGLVKHG